VVDLILMEAKLKTYSFEVVELGDFECSTWRPTGVPYIDVVSRLGD
jgi:hypothetical protein